MIRHIFFYLSRDIVEEYVIDVFHKFWAALTLQILVFYR